MAFQRQRGDIGYSMVFDADFIDFVILWLNAPGAFFSYCSRKGRYFSTLVLLIVFFFFCIHRFYPWEQGC